MDFSVWFSSPVPTIPYVSEQSASNAEMIERRFQDLPPIAGVIFVGVSARPIIGGNCSHFIVRLGLSKRVSEDIGIALINQVLEKELKLGTITVSASVYRGFTGACRDESLEKSNPSSPAANDSVRIG